MSTKSFMPTKTDDDFHFTQFQNQQKFNKMHQNIYSPIIPKVSSTFTKPSSIFSRNINFDDFATPQNNSYGNEMPYSYQSDIPMAQPTKVIRPYIDFDDEESIIFELNKKRQNFDIEPTKKFDQGSIADMDLELDQQKMHVAKMVKNLGGLLTSMSYLMK